MKTFIVHYYVGEDKYWTEVQADTEEEAKSEFYDSISIYNIEEEK